MARLQRIAPLGIPQHIIQRGNNRQACFACDKDRAFFASLLHEYSRKFSVSLHAWVFMTNHVHLLVSPHKIDGISNMMQSVYETPHIEISFSLTTLRSLIGSRFSIS